LDKVVFTGITLEKWFPTTIAWTKLEVHKRIDNEEKMVGVFGRDVIRGTFNYDNGVQDAEVDL